MSFYDELFGRREIFSADKAEILFRKEEYEKKLNDMWRIYQSGTVMQIGEYNKQLEMIKSAGLKVLRNSAGKHKVVSE